MTCFNEKVSSKYEVLLQNFIFLLFLVIDFDTATAIMTNELIGLAHNGEFPNAVTILRSGEVFGGGTLVSPTHVITSCRIVGHFEPPVVKEYLRNRTKDFRPFPLNNVTLVAGSRWIYSLEGGQSRKAGDSYPHPSCVDTKFDIWLHDVGVIEATRQFDFGHNLHALYFWTNSRFVWKKALDAMIGTTCTIIGWGQTRNRNFSEWLIFAHVKLVKPTACVNRLCTKFHNACESNLTDRYFETNGKLCSKTKHSDGGPSIGDLGNALYCNGHYYGLISHVFNASLHKKSNVVIFDRVDFSFDLYRTLVLEAQELDDLYFPIFNTVVQHREPHAAAIMTSYYPWLIVFSTFTCLRRMISAICK